MKESVYYIALRSSIEEVKNMSINEPFQHEDIEDKMDSVSICAKFFLQQLDYSSIVEVWNISRVTCQNVNHIVFCLKNVSYCCTCLLQQKKGLICRHYFHLMNITQIARFNMNLIAFRWIPKEHRQNVVAEGDHFGQRRNSDLDDSNKENESINVQLQNPRKVITRGRPKSISHHNYETNRKNKSTMQELTTYKKKKRGPNLCSNCKKPGHNIARCPKKNVEQTNEKETDEETDEEME
ncbi:hypothetical protein C2G38_2306823 [Gigaspora rosea]|uniref:SWIM-type domain-containing protein n=1 Tax=Gigaspora rosea TaxID=44941 RepID=A0A397W2T5_9GLOM|nr:hypothetical protein C2G38_2306823 [Gigaspora rosea]